MDKNSSQQCGEPRQRISQQLPEGQVVSLSEQEDSSRHRTNACSKGFPPSLSHQTALPPSQGQRGIPAEMRPSSGASDSGIKSTSVQ